MKIKRLNPAYKLGNSHEAGCNYAKIYLWFSLDNPIPTPYIKQNGKRRLRGDLVTLDKYIQRTLGTTGGLSFSREQYSKNQWLEEEVKFKQESGHKFLTVREINHWNKLGRERADSTSLCALGATPVPLWKWYFSQQYTCHWCNVGIRNWNAVVCSIHKIRWAKDPFCPYNLGIFLNSVLSSFLMNSVVQWGVSTLGQQVTWLCVLYLSLGKGRKHGGWGVNVTHCPGLKSNARECLGKGHVVPKSRKAGNSLANSY